MMASPSDKSFGKNISKQTSIFDKDTFSRISEVQEAANRSWNSSDITKGTFGRSSLYSTSSTTETAYRSVKTTSVISKDSSAKSTTQKLKTFTSKKTVTRSAAGASDSRQGNGKTTKGTDGDRDDIEKRIEKRNEFPSSSHHFHASDFFKAKFPHDMDGDAFFRSANSRFTMRNLKSTSGWNVEFDEGASLFPDFFPKNDATTKLSFEATWRAVSPTKEFGLAKQAIKNCSWEDEENKNENGNENDAKQIVNSWMQFFGHVDSVKDG